MNVSEKQKCIAEQAIYGDLLGHLQSGEFVNIMSVHAIDVYIKNLGISNIAVDIDKIEPVLRNLSDLDTVITHKGFNNNESFRAIDKLREICDWINIIPLTDPEGPCNETAYVGVNLESEGEGDLTLSDLQPFYDLLNLLHFDVRGLIKKGEATDANSLEINPYEVPQS